MLDRLKEKKYVAEKLTPVHFEVISTCRLRELTTYFAWLSFYIPKAGESEFQYVMKPNCG